MIPVEALVNGEIPPWIRRFIKHTGRGINKHSMFGEGETILLGISGGKDSLALAMALSLRRKWLPVNYKLKGLMINWREHPAENNVLEDLHRFFRILDIPLEVINAQMFPPSFKGDFNCYLCSRNRRRIMFEHAKTLGIQKIALGHHLDDFVETTIINLCFRGDFSSMKPVQDFFGGKIKILRPMCEIRESLISKLEREVILPVVSTNCPHKEINIRSKVKPIIKQLSHIDKLAREHIYSAHHFEKK